MGGVTTPSGRSTFLRDRRLRVVVIVIGVPAPCGRAIRLASMFLRYNIYECCIENLYINEA